MATNGVFHEIWSDVEPVPITGTTLPDLQIYMAKTWKSLEPSSLLPPVNFISANFDIYETGELLFTFWIRPFILTTKQVDQEVFINDTQAKAIFKNSWYADSPNVWYQGVYSVGDYTFPALPADILPKDMGVQEGAFPYEGQFTSSLNYVTIGGVQHRLWNILASRIETSGAVGGTTELNFITNSNPSKVDSTTGRPLSGDYSWSLPQLENVPDGQARRRAYSFVNMAIPWVRSVSDTSSRQTFLYVALGAVPNTFGGEPVGK